MDPLKDSKPVRSARYPAKGSQRLRGGRASGTDECYFVTTKAFNREKLFFSASAAEIVMNSIEWMERNGRWEWLCYVVMPDHLHLVFELKGDAELGDRLRSFKGFTGHEIEEVLHRTGSVWQDGYFDHRIRSDEKLEQVAFYCFRNPVLAGLVADGKDWPYWKCKPWLWQQVETWYDDLLALEREGKHWMPPGNKEDQ